MLPQLQVISPQNSALDGITASSLHNEEAIEVINGSIYDYKKDRNITSIQTSDTVMDEASKISCFPTTVTSLSYSQKSFQTDNYSELSDKVSELSPSVPPSKQQSYETQPMGGNPPYLSLEELTRLNGGNRLITRILIANNGNAAIKAIRSLRQWAFSMVGDDKALEFVVMATTDDIEANQEYISEGDYLVEVPSGPTNNNFANLYLMVQIAEEYDCDAVWPGWGHASENYKFPLALAASSKKPIWIGPPASAMLALGDKIGSTIIAQSVDVPCVPWSGSHIRCTEKELVDGQLPLELLDEACVKSAEHALVICENLGYPVMIKASAGGGGKGIRKVYKREDVVDAFRQVVNEVKGSRIFIMKLVKTCRHLEVQILSDRYDHTIAVGSRDCSIQRRCQKIIEEGPVVTAPSHIVEQMETAAVRLCSAVHYRNAATCEFMYDLETKQIYFLEVNARLQVEHVVTEVVSDLSLPAAQLQISMGIPLENIPDIKRYLASSSRRNKHCIAARITAEHAEENFKPTCGDVYEIQLRTSMNVWGYFSIGATGKVHAYADSQIGHIFASGRDRESARKNLIMALKGLTVRGEIRTNVEALLRILELSDFITNNTHTTWVESSVEFGSSTLSPESLAVQHPNKKTEFKLLQAVLLAAAYEAFVRFKKSESEFLEKIGQGQLPPTIKVRTTSELVYQTSRFDVTSYHTGPYTVAVQLTDSTCEVLLRPVTLSTTSQATRTTCTDPTELNSVACFLVSGGFDGRSRRVFYKVDTSGIRVTFDGSTFTFIKETDPSQVRAPVSGKLSRWLVASGTAVHRGQTYAEIEIMKMYMQLQVPEAGILSHALAEGAVFKSGDLLATLDIPDGVIFEKAEAFAGRFPTPDKQKGRKSRLTNNALSDTSIASKSGGGTPTILRNFRTARDRLSGALNGYNCDGPDLQQYLDLLLESLFNSSLPQLEVTETLSVMEPHLPPLLAQQLYSVLRYRSIDRYPSVRSFQVASEVSNANEQDGVLSSGANISFNGDQDFVEVLLKTEKFDRKGELPVRHMFDLIEDYLVGQAASGESLQITRIQLEPLTDLLRKYENGLLMFAVDMVVSFLNQYLEVEEMFHQHDSESAAKVLLQKRTEVEALQLAVLARSHQALSEKNTLVIKILGCIKQTTGFMELIPSFSESLQRLSDLSKPEYATVSLRARQLLLTRQQKPFIERSLSLVDSLLDYLERRQPLINGHHQALWTIHSPTTAGGGKQPHHHIPTPITPVSSSNVATFSYSGGGTAGIQSGLGSTNALLLGLATNSLIQCFVSDLEEVGDDSLIALLGHPVGQLRKLALEIYIRRHYDRWGLHGLRIHFDGESWINPLSLPAVDDRQQTIAWRQTQSSYRSTATPSRWGGGSGGGVHLNLLTQEPTTFHETWGGISATQQQQPLWSLPAGGSPTWRAPTITTPKSQNHHSLVRSKFFEEPTGIPAVGIGTANSSERLNHLPSRERSNESLSSGLMFGSAYAPRSGVSQMSSEVADVESKIMVEEDRSRQRVNKLLAVWVHTSVMSRELLADTCDLVTAARSEGRPAPPSSCFSVPPRHPYSPFESENDSVSIVPRPGSHSAFALLANPSGASNSHSVNTTSGYNSGTSSSAIGLNSDSRLHHMLNAFAGVSGESSDQSVGRSQMTVAMAFSTFENFKTTFSACLDEYAKLQEAMPPAPPGPDGKFLMLFVPDLTQLSDPSQRHSALSEIDSCHQGKTKYPLSCNAYLEAEIQSHSLHLSSLGFYLVGVVFLHGRQIEDFQAEINRSRVSVDSQSMPLEHPPLSNESIGRSSKRYSSTDASDADGLSLSASRRSTFPMLEGFPPRQRLSTHSVTCFQEVSNFDQLLPISEAGEPTSSQGTCSSPHPPPCRVAGPSIRSDSIDSGVRGSSPQLPLLQRHHEFPSIEQPPLQGFPRRIPPEDAFLDIGLVGSSLPRYAYFRNLTELPPSNTFAEVLGDAQGGARTSVFEDSLLISSSFANPSAPVYVEEPLLRNVVCTEFGQLELKRLCNFNVKVEPTTIPNIHMYEATPKAYSTTSNGQSSTQVASVSTSSSTTTAIQPGFPRFFVRILLHYRMTNDDQDTAEQERHFVAALNALEIALKSSANQGSRPSPSHHILMSVILQTTSPNAPLTARASNAHQRLSPAAAEASTMALAKRYQQRLMKNRVDAVEVRFAQRSLQASDTFVPIRLVITNPTGQSLRIQKFVEITDPTTGDLVYSALDASDSLAISVRQPGPFPQSMFQSTQASHYKTELSCPPAMSQKGLEYDGLPVCTPHPLAGPLDEKRAMAASLSTIYIYDFLGLFEEAIKKQWRSCPKYFVPSFRGEQISADVSSSPGTSSKSSEFLHPTTFLPDRVLEYIELKLDDRGEVEEVYRDPGMNDCGMVAWRVVMRTPEFPRGRRLILIGNDVTYLMGTFGVQEDLLFQRVSEVARKQGIPRVYIAVNSGARMGLASEVQRLFKVEWVNTDQPSHGFKYLFVTEEDYRKLRATESIACEAMDHPSHGKIYRITSVIGNQIGLGVENLCGSGAIAGETSRAYQETMTITFVTGRTVGIGAYITRLGQRVIQKSNNAPILLTGYQALNRLIGRDVYCSNDAIGGVDIMSRNGVSHLVVENDMEGCEEVIRWLSYVPEHREGPLPIMVDPTDPITRPIAYKVHSLTEDPRLMLTGCVDARGRWLGGIFDKGSFREVLGDWAKSVIVGRARLGGIPVGVILVETRVTESILPADPAMSNSTETKLIRAGQVWFPDSAYKTAQAINDFNREEIPMMIFANWRGFSGGQRDMFYEVLKFGSFIVDALVDFKQPCLVYIPPKSELRGGAWVVVDPRINSTYMEMFADPESRGGVLEPTGTVEIKFRSKALIELAGRLDPVLQSIAQEDKELASEGVARDDPRRQALKEKKDQRLYELMPIYKQVAVHFADLHDTATRMKRRSAISDIVPWERSRIIKANPSLTLITAEHLIDQWAKESGHAFCNVRLPSLSATCTLNSQFVHWACHSLAEISRHLAELHRDYLKHKVQSISREAPDVVLDVAKETPMTTDPVSLAKLFGGALPPLSSTVSVIQSTFDETIGPLE